MVFIFDPDRLQNLVRATITEHKRHRTGINLFCRLHQTLLAHYGGFICPCFEYEDGREVYVFYTGLTEYLLLIRSCHQRRVHTGLRFFCSEWDIVVKGRIRPHFKEWRNTDCLTLCRFDRHDDDCLIPGDIYHRSYWSPQRVCIDDDTWVLEYGRGFIPEIFGYTLAPENPFPFSDFFNWVGHTIYTDFEWLGDCCLCCCYPRNCKDECDKNAPRCCDDKCHDQHCDNNGSIRRHEPCDEPTRRPNYCNEPRHSDHFVEFEETHIDIKIDEKDRNNLPCNNKSNGNNNSNNNIDRHNGLPSNNNQPCRPVFNKPIEHDDGCCDSSKYAVYLGNDSHNQRIAGTSNRKSRQNKTDNKRYTRDTRNKSTSNNKNNRYHLVV